MQYSVSSNLKMRGWGDVENEGKNEEGRAGSRKDAKEEEEYGKRIGMGNSFGRAGTDVRNGTAKKVKIVR